MKQKLTRNPKIAFYLDETALQRVIEISESFQKVDDFHVELSDGSEMTCNTLDEVLRIPNVKPREITGIKLLSHTGSDDCHLYLSFQQPLYFLGGAFSPVHYSIEGEEKEVSYFASKLDEGLAQARLWYNTFAFRNFGSILFYLFLIFDILLIILIILFEVIGIDMELKSEADSSPGMVFGLLIWLVLIPIASWMQVKLFPVAVFAIGDGIRRYEHIKTIRRVVFGTVLGGISLAVISAVVINLLGL